MRQFLFVLIIVATGCNLSTRPQTIQPSNTPSVTSPSPLLATITLEGASIRPTLLPLPNLPATSFSVTSVPSLGALCQVYVTYSGSRADNKLSLRSAPSSDVLQIFRVPNNTEVLLVPGSQEIEAEGYHWQNVIYMESPQMRYQGWIARDSYEVNGVRDPSIVTLRQAGSEVAC
jgi:hypothetical protein